jgi:ADP-heptose:LPS heptosyltransferase
MEKVGHSKLEVKEIRGDKDEYSFLLVFKKLSSGTLPLAKVEKPNGKTRNTALVVRYGAFGDMIMSTPVFRLLSEQGYHVTVNCTPYAKEVLENNPYVDDVALQQKDLIPNTHLKDYWEDLGKGYDKFVNLSQSVEDSLLVADRRLLAAVSEVKEKHPDKGAEEIFYNIFRTFRNRLGDKNYYDAHLEKGGFEERGLNGELYFSQNEELIAQDFRHRHRDKFLILWSLSGSSYHKIYPYFQRIVQELLIKYKDAMVVSVGDDICTMMERGESDRYLPRSGVWSIRRSLIMTKHADLVIGPETGILNAAGCFDTPKITLLSHSNHTNLCKYWENDFCIAPINTFCYPCHTLHYQHHCGQDVTCPICNDKHYTEWCTEGSHPHEHMTCPSDDAITKEVEKRLPPEMQTGASVALPICMSKGIMPDRVLERIDEVYQKFWKKAPRLQSRSAVSLPVLGCSQ